MAQLDVYRNPSKATQKAYPLFLDIQNRVISDVATRIVVPLGRSEHFKSESMTKLTRSIEYDDDLLLLLTPQISSVPSKILKEPVGSLEHFRDEIIAAVDFAITGIQHIASTDRLGRSGKWGGCMKLLGDLLSTQY